MCCNVPAVAIIDKLNISYIFLVKVNHEYCEKYYIVP